MSKFEELISKIVEKRPFRTKVKGERLMKSHDESASSEL